MNYKKDYIAKGTKRRSGLKLTGPKFIVAHDTGNPNSTAKNNVDYYKRTANEMSASAHLFVDDKECVECIPLSEKAWHVLYDRKEDNRMFGGDANDIAIGVELCYFSKDKKRSLRAYENYVQVFANLCRKYKLNPKKHIVGHSRLDPGRKTDPENALKRIGKTFESLVQDVENKLRPRITNKERCTVSVKFASNSSSKLKAYQVFLKKLKLDSDVRKGEKQVVINVVFAAESYRYREVITWLDEHEINYDI